MRFLLALSLLILPAITYAEDLSLCMAGWKATQSGDHQKAIALYTSCIDTGNLKNASLARTYRNLGIASKRSKQFEAAIAYYDKALSLKPEDAWDDYVNRGNAWSGLGEYRKAFDDYDRAMALKPNYNEAYYNRGIVFEKQGKFSEALNEFLKAYKHGLANQALYERFVVYGVIKPKKTENTSKTVQ